jgi:hypothetical protein
MEFLISVWRSDVDFFFFFLKIGDGCTTNGIFLPLCFLRFYINQSDPITHETERGFDYNELHFFFFFFFFLNLAGCLIHFYTKNRKRDESSSRGSHHILQYRGAGIHNVFPVLDLMLMLMPGYKDRWMYKKKKKKTYKHHRITQSFFFSNVKLLVSEACP